MKRVSISEISKKPSILDDIDDVVEIVNKKTNEVKGVFISAKDLPFIKDIIEELEYRKWLKRNKGLLENPPKDLEGIFDKAIIELGEKLD